MPHVPRFPRRIRTTVLLGVLALVAAATVVAANPAGAASTLLSQGKPATASSVENAGTPASAAVDGSAGTRWSSAFSDPQWIQVDLGASATLTQVVLQWESAYATAFTIQASDNGSTWSTVYSTTAGTGGTQTLTITGSGRYVRLTGTARATGYGYSLWEFQVFGETAATGTCGSTNVAQAKPATASSVENAATPASAAVDGNAGTRWSSAFSDPQWIQVDLGASTAVCRVVLQWEAAYATAFAVQVSDNASTWSTITTVSNGTGGTQTLAVSGTGRYLRLNLTARGTGFGYSVWELGVITSGGPTGTGNLISQFQPVTASSYEGGNAPAAALDGRTTTRWSSQFTDPQWIAVDLGGVAAITRVVLNWEAAYATAYHVDVSNDAANWSTVYTTTAGHGGVETIPLSASGRYVRLYGTARATGYGYSLWEFQVFGTVDTSTATPTMLSGPTKAPGTTGQFGLSAPADGAMLTTTRRPAFTWPAVSGAVRYQVWLNISRTDYDFTASGNLIDLYTKVAEPTSTSYTPTWDLPDRWTYKWFVVAVNGSNGTTTSSIRTFSLYLPTVASTSDGVRVINGSRDLNKDGAIQPYEDWRQPVETGSTI